MGMISIKDCCPYSNKLKKKIIKTDDDSNTTENTVARVDILDKVDITSNLMPTESNSLTKTIISNALNKNNKLNTNKTMSNIISKKNNENNLIKQFKEPLIIKKEADSLDKRNNNNKARIACIPNKLPFKKPFQVKGDVEINFNNNNNNNNTRYNNLSNITNSNNIYSSSYISNIVFLSNPEIIDNSNNMSKNTYTSNNLIKKESNITKNNADNESNYLVLMNVLKPKQGRNIEIQDSCMKIEKERKDITENSSIQYNSLSDIYIAAKSITNNNDSDNNLNERLIENQSTINFFNFFNEKIWTIVNNTSETKLNNLLKVFNYIQVLTNNRKDDEYIFSNSNINLKELNYVSTLTSYELNYNIEYSNNISNCFSLNSISLLFKIHNSSLTNDEISNLTKIIYDIVNTILSASNHKDFLKNKNNYNNDKINLKQSTEFNNAFNYMSLLNLIINEDNFSSKQMKTKLPDSYLNMKIKDNKKETKGENSYSISNKSISAILHKNELDVYYSNKYSTINTNDVNNKRKFSSLFKSNVNNNFNNNENKENKVYSSNIDYNSKSRSRINNVSVNSKASMFGKSIIPNINNNIRNNVINNVKYAYNDNINKRTISKKEDASTNIKYRKNSPTKNKYFNSNLITKRSNCSNLSNNFSNDNDNSKQRDLSLTDSQNKIDKTNINNNTFCISNDLDGSKNSLKYKNKELSLKENNSLFISIESNAEKNTIINDIKNNNSENNTTNNNDDRDNNTKDKHEATNININKKLISALTLIEYLISNSNNNSTNNKTAYFKLNYTKNTSTFTYSFLNIQKSHHLIFLRLISLLLLNQSLVTNFPEELNIISLVENLRLFKKNEKDCASRFSFLISLQQITEVFSMKIKEFSFDLNISNYSNITNRKNSINNLPSCIYYYTVSSNIFNCYSYVFSAKLEVINDYLCANATCYVDSLKNIISYLNSVIKEVYNCYVKSLFNNCKSYDVEDASLLNTVSRDIKIDEINSKRNNYYDTCNNLVCIDEYFINPILFRIFVEEIIDIEKYYNNTHNNHVKLKLSFVGNKLISAGIVININVNNEFSDIRSEESGSLLSKRFTNIYNSYIKENNFISNMKYLSLCFEKKFKRNVNKISKVNKEQGSLLSDFNLSIINV